MNQNKGIFLIFLTAFISGLSIFINKFGVDFMNPYIFIGLKNSLVAFLVIGLILIMKDWKALLNLRKKEWFGLFGVGLLGGFIPFILFFKGLTMISAAQAGFIHKLMFIFVFVLASIFLKEKIKQVYLISGLLLLLGNLFLLNLLPLEFNFGSLLILLAIIFWAAETVLSKYLLKKLSARIIMGGRMFLGSIFIFIFLLFTSQAGLIFELNLQQIGWIMITGVFLFGYIMTWYTGLKYVKVSVAVLILLLASPITSLLSLIFLNQAWTGMELTGLSFCLGAGLLVWTMNKYYVSGKTRFLE